MTTSFKRQIAFALYTLALGIPHLAYALPKASSVPGGVALVTLGQVSASPQAPQAWLGDQPVWVTAKNGLWIAVVGLALDIPVGTIELCINDGGHQKQLYFEVGAKHYSEQRITLRDSSKVNLSAADEQRAITEIARIQNLKRHWRVAPISDTPDVDFILPAQGRMASRFGLRRIFNGEPRAPHSGLDIAVPRGTPIKADAQGIVLAVDDYFFNGKTIFVDHGNGLISMYCHLDRIDVQRGETVRQGHRIGLAGMTGRASGPHLHWSVILNGAMVDPALFLPSP